MDIEEFRKFIFSILKRCRIKECRVMFKGNSQSGFEIVSLSVCPKKQLINILQEKYIKKLIKSNVVDFDCEFFQNIKDKIEYYKRKPSNLRMVEAFCHSFIRNYMKIFQHNENDMLCFLISFQVQNNKIFVESWEEMWSIQNKLQGE